MVPFVCVPSTGCIKCDSVHCSWHYPESLLCGIAVPFGTGTNRVQVGSWGHANPLTSASSFILLVSFPCLFTVSSSAGDHKKMAELAISIAGLSAVGFQLTKSLHKFDSTFAAARKQTRRISERISDYTTILDLHAATIEDDLSICSGKAIETLDRLCDQSADLFEEVEALLPQQKPGRGRNDLSFAEKVKWNFRKSKVELVLGEIEIVKSNILLHLMTILLGRKIRSSKWRLNRSSQQTQDDGIRAVQQQQIRAKNAVAQHLGATENLSKLQEAADMEDNPQLQGQRPTTTSRAIALATPQNDVLANFQQASLGCKNTEEKQAYVVAQSLDSCMISFCS